MLDVVDFSQVYSVLLLLLLELLLLSLHDQLVSIVLADQCFVRAGSANRKHDGQVAKSVEDADDDDEDVHAEVVQFEKGRWGESKHQHTQAFGGGDADHHRATHIVQGFHSSFLARACLLQEVHTDMVAELDTEAETGDQVDNQDGVDL